MPPIDMPDSAPEFYRYCPRCAATLETRTVGDKRRRTCPDCDFIYFTDPKVGVGVAVIHEDQILLVKRDMDPERGKWSLPAGFVDRGEDPQRTAIREVWEETGLEVQIEGLIDVYYNPPSNKGGASIFILYQGQLLGGTLQAGDDAAEAEFFDRCELPALAFASTRDAIQRWLTDSRDDTF